MARLVPAIHVFGSVTKQDADARAFAARKGASALQAEQAGHGEGARHASVHPGAAKAIDAATSTAPRICYAISCNAV